MLIVVAPITAPLPGPAATFIFAGGAGAGAAEFGLGPRRFATYKRRWPRTGAWVDWALRRASAKRRASATAIRRTGGAVVAQIDLSAWFA